MFILDRITSAIRHTGEASIELLNLKVRVSVNEKESIELYLKEPEAVENENCPVYADAQESIRVQLFLSSEEKAMSIQVKAEISNQTAYHKQTNFSAYNSISIIISEIKEIQGVMANSRHKEWWTRPHFDTDLRKLPPQTQSLLLKTEKEYGYMLPLCNSSVRTDLEGTEDGLEVKISALEMGHESISSAVLMFGVGTDPYRLIKEVVTEAFSIRKLGEVTREYKIYPEILDYLGWCSWDAFYSEVNEEGLISKAEEINEKELPVKWFMIDDGWSEVKEKKLYSFQAETLKFPSGIKHTIRHLKDVSGIRWVGVWQNIAGYWGGVDP